MRVRSRFAANRRSRRIRAQFCQCDGRGHERRGRILRSVSDLLSLDDKTRRTMRNAAIQTSLEYSVEKAAYSEYVAFSEFLAN
jgi:hypothetical protein